MQRVAQPARELRLEMAAVSSVPPGWLVGRRFEQR